MNNTYTIRNIETWYKLINREQYTKLTNREKYQTGTTHSPVIKGGQFLVKLVCDFVVELFRMRVRLFRLLDLLVIHFGLRTKLLCEGVRVVRG